MVPEGTFSIALDLHHDLVELNYVLDDTLTVLHGQVVELVLHISNRVMWTKVYLEFQDKLLVVFHPEWTEVRVVYEEEVWFEPLQGDTLEVGLHKGHFGVVLSECPRQFWKFSSHCTRKTWSLRGSVPSHWSSSQTLVHCKASEGL